MAECMQTHKTVKWEHAEFKLSTKGGGGHWITH